jgi:hypothetical protein
LQKCIDVACSYVVQARPVSTTGWAMIVLLIMMQLVRVRRQGAGPGAEKKWIFYILYASDSLAYVHIRTTYDNVLATNINIIYSNSSTMLVVQSS